MGELTGAAPAAIMVSMHRWLAPLVLMGSGCAGLLGIEDLAGESDSQVDVQVFVDRLPAAMVDVIGHKIDGSVSDHQQTDNTGTASVAIPGGGGVSVLIEISPAQFELRTWLDLDDLDSLVVNAVIASPTIDAEVTLSDQNTNNLTAWRVRYRDTAELGTGSLGTAEMVALDRNNLSDSQTISAVARLRSIGTTQRVASVVDVPASTASVTSVVFPDWTGDLATDAVAITAAPMAVEGTVLTGEVRDGQFFIGEANAVDIDETLDESYLIDRGFAQLIGVAFDDVDDNRVQTDFVAADATAFTVEPTPLAELTDASAEREPRPQINWTAAAGDGDAVLGRVQLFDLAAPDKKLIWRVEANAARGLAILPRFPGDLPVDPDDFAGFDDGELQLIASDAHDGYRALRAGGVQLTGHMASEPPILDAPGRVRAERLTLPPP